MAGVYHSLVYMETAQISNKTHHHWGVPGVFCYLFDSLHIHQERVYTTHFLMSSKPQHSGGVYMVSPLCVSHSHYIENGMLWHEILMGGQLRLYRLGAFILRLLFLSGFHIGFCCLIRIGLR